MQPYRRVNKRIVYRNPWVEVEAHEVLHPNGRAGEHVLVRPPAGSGVVVDDDGDLLFARQMRFAAEMEFVEICKGGASGDEDALACAKRELHEELGLVAAQWEPLGELYELPSIVAGAFSLFLARGIEHVMDDQDEIETIELVRVPAAQAIAAAASGAITDAVTVAALLRYGVATKRLTIV